MHEASLVGMQLSLSAFCIDWVYYVCEEGRAHGTGSTSLKV